jgi:hypothetical protein
MTEPQLTPEQTARLNKLAARCFRCSAALAGGSWLLLAAAIWFTSWRLFGLGLLVAVLAGVGFLLTGFLHGPEARKRTAQKINGGTRP